MSTDAGFMHRGPLSPRVHGTFDYLLAVGTAWSRGIVRVLPPLLHGLADIGATVALIVAPLVLGFTDDSTATAFCIAVGAGGLLATLLTRFESDLEPLPSPARATTAR